MNTSSLSTREYDVCRYGMILRIRRDRLDPAAPNGLADSERIGRVMARWMVRHAARQIPTAVLSDAPASVRAQTDAWTWQAAVLGYSYAIRDVHPDDRETARWWLHESPPRHHRLIVPGLSTASF